VMLPWFQNNFPVYLAPMAGVTDKTFRQLCKEMGADVMVTEFVSAEGILHRNKRTSEYLEFDPIERPLGVQLFGAEPDRLGEAARNVINWVHPDFIDLNFGCPVNKVVSKNGGSALLRDCPLLERVARSVVRAAAPVPVTAKIRIGWSDATINATTTAAILEQAGVQAVAVHGRTKEQGYSGEANWDVIAQVAEAVKIPVIGNGDIESAADVLHRQSTTRVSGVMIGRAAMASPWIFRDITALRKTGTLPPPPTHAERWALIRRHCELAALRNGNENMAMRFMRGRLMAYSKTLPHSKMLRVAFSKVDSLEGLDSIAEENLQHEQPGVATA